MQKHTIERPEVIQPSLPQSLADLLCPEAVLPEQFFSGPRTDSDSSPERALMLAVLEDGIRCFHQFMSARRVRHRMLSRQAERWIRADDWEWPFSFNNVCESLGIDPSCLRKALLRLKYDHLSGNTEAKEGSAPTSIEAGRRSAAPLAGPAARGNMKARRMRQVRADAAASHHQSTGKKETRKAVN